MASPMQELIARTNPALLDNPMVAQYLDQFGALVSPEDAAKLETALPALTTAYETSDYPLFKSTMESAGWGGMAPLLYGMMQDAKESSANV